MLLTVAGTHCRLAVFGVSSHRLSHLLSLSIRRFSSVHFHRLLTKEETCSGDDMFRVLNVAEKNDAAKSLADIMSGGRYSKVVILINLSPRRRHRRRWLPSAPVVWV